MKYNIDLFCSKFVRSVVAMSMSNENMAYTCLLILRDSKRDTLALDGGTAP